MQCYQRFVLLRTRDLSQKLLGTDQTVPNLDSIGAFDDAGRTIAATYISDFLGHAQEITPGLMETAAKIAIS